MSRGNGRHPSRDAAGAVQTRPPQRFAFVLLPKFSMMAFASAIEPLRIANRMAERTLYDWQIVSKEGGLVRASNGCMVATDQGLAEVSVAPGQNLPTLILCTGLGAEHIADRELFAWLRRADRSGAVLGAICTGAHLLARAGLLDGHRCTIHWENLPGFMEQFPEIDVSADLFEVDRNRLTCAGGTAARDLMLHLIARDHGQALAVKVSEQCLHGSCSAPASITPGTSVRLSGAAAPPARRSSATRPSPSAIGSSPPSSGARFGRWPRWAC
jgi:transcriptional regulator GlxA family with amidase domain